MIHRMFSSGCREVVAELEVLLPVEVTPAEVVLVVMAAEVMEVTPAEVMEVKPAEVMPVLVVMGAEVAVS